MPIRKVDGSTTEVPNDRLPMSLADRIERIPHAMTAREVAVLLAVAVVTVYQHAAASRIPSFRVGTSVRFDPFAVAKYVRSQ